MKETALLMFGPPNSGKGTYGRRIAGLLERKYICAGDLIREQLDEDEGWFEGRYSWEKMNDGKFLPFDLMCALIRKHIERASGSCVVDGFPRDIDQLGEFEAWEMPYSALWIEHEDELLIARALSRMICSSCGKIYSRGNPHMETGPDDSCVSCGGTVARRSDDEEDVARGRLELYRQVTQPIKSRCIDGAIAFKEVSPEGGDVDQIAAEMAEEARDMLIP